MPIPFLAIAAGINALRGLAKAGIGASQAKRAKSYARNMLADRPKYEIPKEYEDVISTYQRLASTTPEWARIQESEIGRISAKASERAKEGAISSVAYQDAISGIQDKELSAITDLYARVAQTQEGYIDKTQGAKLQMGEQKAQQWNINEYVPWQMQKTIENEQGQAGLQNIFTGIGDITGSLSNLAGTSAYLKALQSMYPQKETT